MVARAARRLLVLGWDAADWQVIDPLLARGAMPNLARLVAAGTRAELRTMDPKLSPILWTTIATGRTADRHGILNFVEPSPSGDGIRVASSTSRRGKALWNILTQRGLRVHVVGWYASHPAEPVSGTCVSNLLMEQMPADAISPWPLQPGCVHAGGHEAGAGDMGARIAAARVRACEIGREQLKDVLPHAAQAGRGDPRPGILVRELARMRSLHRAALVALEGGAWDCAMVFHDTIDTIGHHFMEFRPPRMPHVRTADLRVYGEVMDRVYREHDRLLGELLAACGEGTSVLLVSDHGFHSGAGRPVISDVTKEERAALESRWHRAFGVMVLSGPGFAAGGRIGAPSVIDVTPTALAALGVPVGRDMAGRVISEAFAQPPAVETVESWDSEPGEAGMHPAELRQDPFEAADALRQLVDLGYMADLGEDHARMVEVARRESRYNLAVVLMTTGRPAEAVPHLRALAADCPGEVRYASALAQCEQSSGDHAASLASIDRWAQLSPDAAEPGFLRVAALAALGRAAEAARALEEVERRHGADDATATTRSELCARLGWWPDAARHAERAIAADRGSPEAHLAAARAALELGEFERAAEHCLDATEISMAIPEAHYLLGAALAWGGELGHAARSLEVTLKFAPQHREALCFAAAVEAARGNAAAAADLSAQAEAAAPAVAVRPTSRDAAHWARARGMP